MHFFDFLQLEENDQIEVLWYNGEQVGTRKDGDFLMLLYQVEGFYVEVYYHTKDRIIKRYLCFECTDLIEPYIKGIDLSPIYKYLNKTAKKHDDSVLDGFAERNMGLLPANYKKQSQNKSLTNLVSEIFNSLFNKSSKKHS